VCAEAFADLSAQAPARAATAQSPVGPRIAELEAGLVVEHQRSVGHRADYERAERMVNSQDRLIGELENLRSLLEEQSADRSPP